MAEDIIANVSRGWQREPSLLHRGSDASRVSAALWLHGSSDIQVVTADPDPRYHLVTFTLDSMLAEMSFEGRLAWRGQTGRDGLCIVSAGREPSCQFKGLHRNLHLYVPASAIDELATEAAGAERRGVVLTDPRCTVADESLLFCAQQVLDELREPQPLGRLRLDLLGQELALHLLRRHSTERLTEASARPCRCDWRVARVVDAVEADLEHDWQLEELAAIAAVTPRHLASLFRSDLGQSPLRWIMDRRFERAKARLVASAASVTQIAAECGFASAQHLATVFRQRLGTSPSDYRRFRRY